MEPPVRIPARTSLRPRDVHQRPNHRAEGSDGTTRSAATSRRNPNRVKVQPASTEVISSLISSLSSFSAPADDHFDHVPQMPAAQAYDRPSSSRLGNHTRHTSMGSDVDLSLFEAPGLEYLLPNAARPPTVKTSRPPSGYSQYVAPRTSAGNNTSWPLPVPLPLQPIGNVTVLPRNPQSNPSVRSVKKRSSLKLQRSVDLKASKEKMRDMDRQRRMNTSVQDADARSPTKSIREEYMASGSDPPPGSIANGPPAIPERGASALSSRAAEPETPLSETFPGTNRSSRTIPNRNSSLFQTPPPRRKRKTHKAKRPPTSHDEVPAVRDLDSTMPDLLKKPLEERTEFDTVRRIAELKAQKEARIRDQENEAMARMRVDVEAAYGTEVAYGSEIAYGTERGRAAKPTRSGHRSLSKASRRSSRARSRSRSRVYSRMNSPTGSRRRSWVGPSTHGNMHQRSASAQMERYQNDNDSMADSIDDAVEDYVCAPRLSQKIWHPTNGRIISFSEVGDPNGFAVFCCVGMGLTRFLTAFYDELALTLKLRLITPDRPGVGESDPYIDGIDTPLGWPDDIRAICSHLGIARFSILAHSAGAIYALATALRMPQHIRGKIHLLAPWIPPSQMVAIGINKEPIPVTSLPASQRFLRSLPTPLLKAANNPFFAATSNSLTTSIPKSSRARAKRRSLEATNTNATAATAKPNGRIRRASMSLSNIFTAPSNNVDAPAVPNNNANNNSNLPPQSPTSDRPPTRQDDQDRASEYDARLTTAIWDLATTNANPARDLLICLERTHDIGFRYVDITKEVVMHHGSKDNRVPVENVIWLGKTMRKCEVRVLEGEGHGLMASATVMGSVLTEMAGEWETWERTKLGRKSGEDRSYRA